MKNYFSISLSNLKRRKLRAWLTMLGIFIGIAAVVSLITLGNGLRTAVTGQFGSLSIDTLTIQNAETGFGPPGSTAIEKLEDSDLEIINSISGIEKVIPRWIRISKLEYNGVSRFFYLSNIPEEKDKIDFVYSNTGLKIDEGKLLKQGDRGKVLLGSQIAGKNTFGKKIRIGNKIEIQGEEFEVVGILKPSSSFVFNGVVLMMQEDMKDLLEIDDEWDLIVAKVEDRNKIQDIAEDIKKELRKDRKLKKGEEDFSVQTPLEGLSAVNTILNVINIVVTGIASISLIIGGIGIANTMYTSVLERNKEIGTMKAIGARNKDILFIFLIESALLGLVGGIIGAGLGLGLAFLISIGASAALGSNILQVSISYLLLLGAIGFSALIGMLAGTLPAIQASKLNPSEALRK